MADLLLQEEDGSSSALRKRRGSVSSRLSHKSMENMPPDQGTI